MKIMPSLWGSVGWGCQERIALTLGFSAKGITPPNLFEAMTEGSLFAFMTVMMLGVRQFVLMRVVMPVARDVVSFVAFFARP